MTPNLFAQFNRFHAALLGLTLGYPLGFLLDAIFAPTQASKILLFGYLYIFPRLAYMMIKLRFSKDYQHQLFGKKPIPIIGEVMTYEDSKLVIYFGTRIGIFSITWISSSGLYLSPLLE